MKTTQFINIEKISSIKLVYETPAQDIKWKEPKPKKWFWQKNTPSHGYWYDIYNERLGKDIELTEDDLKNLGYKVYPWEQRINNRICYKSYVIIKMDNRDEIYSEMFETEDEMEQWVQGLIDVSNKKFTLIERHYEN